METFDQTMQKLVNSDYETLLSFAKQAIARLLPVCKTIDPKNNGFLMISSIVLSAIGSDKKLSQKETDFLRDCLGLDDEHIVKYINLYSPEMEALVDKFADEISAEIKLSTVALVAAIAACDEKICREESAFIRKILA